MAEKENTEFEHTLGDILQPEDPDTGTSASDTDDAVESRKKPGPSVVQKKSREYPKWLDVVVRVAAVILVSFLLLMFAFNIITR